MKHYYPAGPTPICDIFPVSYVRIWIDQKDRLCADGSIKLPPLRLETAVMAWEQKPALAKAWQHLLLTDYRHARPSRICLMPLTSNSDRSIPQVDLDVGAKRRQYIVKLVFTHKSLFSIAIPSDHQQCFIITMLTCVLHACQLILEAAVFVKTCRWSNSDRGDLIGIVVPEDYPCQRDCGPN